MPFKKKNKESKGRPKGGKNKKTTENKERINKVLSYIDDKYLIEDIDNLTSSERVKTYISLMEYIIPKLARKDHTGDNQNKLQIEIEIVKNDKD